MHSFHVALFRHRNRDDPRKVCLAADCSFPPVSFILSSAVLLFLPVSLELFTFSVAAPHSVTRRGEGIFSYHSNKIRQLSSMMNYYCYDYSRLPLQLVSFSRIKTWCYTLFLSVYGSNFDSVSSFTKRHIHVCRGEDPKNTKATRTMPQ